MQYHSWLLDRVPQDCERALDVGCGDGVFACELAQFSAQVVALDLTLTPHEAAPANVLWLAGDVLTFPFTPGTFDFIALIATLHHLPLATAFQRVSALLRPGGVLAIVGLYVPQTIADHLLATVAYPVSQIVRTMLGRRAMGSAMRPPRSTLQEIKQAAKTLPGAVVTRRLFFRYTLTWAKPSESR